MFRMNVTTNFKFKTFKKGISYKDDSIPKEVLERWLERKLAKVIKEVVDSPELKENKKGQSKKNDNTVVQSNISDKKKLPGND